MKMLFHSLDLRFPEQDARTRDVEIIGQKMEHLTKIVEQVLDYERTNEPQVTPTSLNRLIDDLCLLMRHKLINQRIQLVRKLDPALPPVLADAVQLEQTFLNLTLNAVEAMPEGGVLTISTGTLPRKQRNTTGTALAFIRFKDTGHGMTETQRRGAFSSLLSTSKVRGTGLGLAIVRKVVEAHDGEIKVQSREGDGTAITILLPMSPREPELPRVAEPQSGSAPS
jgi:signal transduction histidine kinase